ncbi:MAG: hypothetical protein N4A45_07790 [Flavobacteriales bacterium]|jgi:hypothetical protein|nr:hypothetical protein [Flavobacteriales bacterium]
MKNIFLLITLLLNITIVFSQDQETEIGQYRLRRDKSFQDTVYMKTGSEEIKIPKGWTITETIAGISTQRTLDQDYSITVKKYVPIEVKSNWKIGEIKHSDEEPDKLYLNPYHFIKKKYDSLNNKGYIKIPENSSVTLVKSFVKWQTITIPFAIRPALNDSIGSKVTTDLKIGASISYNYNWEKFKNRRIKAKKSSRGVSVGVGFGFSKVTLNSSSTSLLNRPYKNEEDGLAFFISPGIGLNLKGFQVNFSYGWDIPVTENVKDWNYANEGYLGIGLGVGLDVFGK